MFEFPRCPFWVEQSCLTGGWDLVLSSKALPVLIIDFIHTHSSEWSSTIPRDQVHLPKGRFTVFKILQKNLLEVVAEVEK